MHTDIAAKLDAMLGAAEADGLTLTGSGYRSHEDQIRLRRLQCGPTHYDIYLKPSSQCSLPTAIPGKSKHEVGLAVDFNNCSTRQTACYRWLSAHAAAYGFYNFPREAWHWSVDGS